MRHNLVAKGTINMASRLAIATCAWHRDMQCCPGTKTFHGTESHEGAGQGQCGLLGRACVHCIPWSAVTAMSVICSAADIRSGTNHHIWSLDTGLDCNQTARTVVRPFTTLMRNNLFFSQIHCTLHNATRDTDKGIQLALSKPAISMWGPLAVRCSRYVRVRAPLA